MWKVGGIKIGSTWARYFFGGTGKEIREIGDFFINRSLYENFQREKFLGQVTKESLRTQDSENLYERCVQIFLDTFATHILNRLDMRILQVASKIYHTYKKNWVIRDWVIHSFGHF